MNWTEQVNPVTRHTHWSRVSASRLYFALTGLSKTRTVSARLVLNISNTAIQTGLAQFSSVQVS